MPDSNLPEKMDSGLKAAFRAWNEAGAEAQTDAGISVSLRYEGDLAVIEAIGFKTDMVMRDSALGVVRFKDIPDLVAHPGVLWLAAGRRRTADLETAARDIRARATAPVSGAPVDGLWHIPTTGGTISNVTGGSGAGVIVAIIDTGIDYKHPMFMTQLGPTFQTRIIKIWDQGLTPTAFSDCPNVARLGSSDTYGVEYDENEIEAALNGGTPIRHRDCDGHGTHCAGIAAGGSLFPTGGNARNVGVAPGALIMAVKYLDTPDQIFYRKPDNSVGDEVQWEHRFKDAVLYCLRTARDEFNFPVVISMSFGSGAMPGDGLDSDAVFVDDLMDPTAAVGPNHFPRGAVIVKSSGNDGDISENRTARIVVPAGGITIPFELTDSRGTLQTQWDQCAQNLYKPNVGVHFWYRAPTVGAPVQFSAREPHGVAFTAPVSNGADLEIGYRQLIGPPPRTISALATAAFHRMGLDGEAHPAVPHPGGGGDVQRNYMNFYVKPKETGGTISYNPGIYEVRITAPVGTVIWVMCDERFWAARKAVIFALASTMQDTTIAAPGPPNLNPTEDSSSTDPLGRHVITVASYDDQNGGGSASTRGRIAASSSRGPLRDFSDPATPLGPIAAKPDIAAPGVRINSAEGIDTEPPLLPRTPAWRSGRRFVEHSGTSMATPMVAGVVALMLHKRGTLNITDVRTALTAAPRAAVSPASAPASTNAYGSGRVDAMTSHSNTP